MYKEGKGVFKDYRAGNDWFFKYSENK